MNKRSYNDLNRMSIPKPTLKRQTLSNFIWNGRNYIELKPSDIVNIEKKHNRYSMILLHHTIDKIDNYLNKHNKMIDYHINSHFNPVNPINIVEYIA